MDIASGALAASTTRTALATDPHPAALSTTTLLPEAATTTLTDGTIPPLPTPMPMADRTTAPRGTSLLPGMGHTLAMGTLASMIAVAVTGNSLLAETFISRGLSLTLNRHRKWLDPSYRPRCRFGA